MPVVTDIREQANHPERRSVYVDGRFAFSATADQLAEQRIGIGDYVTEERVADLVAATEARQARDYILCLLGRRAYSESEVRQRLRRKHFSDAAMESAVQDLRRLGLLDDRQFAQAWVRGRAAAGGTGRRRLEWELRSRGVDRQVIAESLAGIGGEKEFSLALEAAQRRYARLRNEEPEVLRRKLASFLLRRGFEYENINKVLDTILPPE